MKMNFALFEPKNPLGGKMDLVRHDARSFRKAYGIDNEPELVSAIVSSNVKPKRLLGYLDVRGGKPSCSTGCNESLAERPRPCPNVSEQPKRIEQSRLSGAVGAKDQLFGR